MVKNEGGEEVVVIIDFGRSLKIEGDEGLWRQQEEEDELHCYLGPSL